MGRLKFQDQLRRSFLRYISVIIAATLLLFLGGFAFNFFTVVVGGCRESNRQLTASFEAQYAAYEAGLNELVSLPEVADAAAGTMDVDLSAANRILYQFANSQDFKSYFILLDRDGKAVCSNLNDRNRDAFASSTFADSVRSRLDNSPGELLCFVCSAPLTTDQRCCYSLCRAVPGPDGEWVGYLFFNLRQESLRSLIRTMPQDVLITDRYDNIIYTTLDLEEDPMDKLPSGKYSLGIEESGILRLDNEYQYVSVGIATPQALRFYTLTSLAMQMRALGYSLLLFLILFLMLLGIVAMLTRAFARQNAQELRELTKAVEYLGRDSTDYQLPPRCSEECQQLYTEFRELTCRLRELIRHNSELQERRRRMEVKQLEEQFNPHFVFNVMETVRYQIKDDPEAASKMLLSFANLMRYSINYGHTEVSLETDVEYVNDYLLLQKVRYNNRLRYEFRIPDELLECRVPKLLLQPVIENSIKHGFRPDRDLELVISAWQEGENLRFTVRDNGVGIAPDRLAALRESLTLEVNDPSITHIGLYNIHKVLRLLYGSGYGLTIDSTAGEGTTVTLTMPCKMEEGTC